jgi:dsRNA-specific ribonuclease
MYGNAFEAFIGAIYIDRGYEYCRIFIEDKIINQFIDLEKISLKEVNFKSKLIEWSQKNKVCVSFELIEQFPDSKGSPMFQTEVLTQGLSAGSGIGYSKKESQQKAAKMALDRIKKMPHFVERIFDEIEAAKGTSEEEQNQENINSSAIETHTILETTAGL